MKKIKVKYQKASHLKVYLYLRALVILTMILQLLNGNYENAFLCILTLILFLIPVVIKKRLNIELPDTLEIIIYLFIFSAEILGEIQNFYGIFNNWDTILHTINGFLAAAIGLSLIDILNRNNILHSKLTPAFVSLVAFCFSMTIGIFWEFFEYSYDKFLNGDMQKDRMVTSIASFKLDDDSSKLMVIDNIEKTTIEYRDDKNKINELVIPNGYLDIGLNDTMKDLFVNFIGALVFSILGYFYIKDRKKYNIVENFIPKLKSLMENEVV